MKKPTVGDLKKAYSEADTIDKSHFAEIRTNILLYAGQHYKGQTKKSYERVLEKTDGSLKLKLQENHIGKICDQHIANIINPTPTVNILPHNKNELADQKDAELTQAVKVDAEKKINYSDIMARHGNAFVVQGETAAFFYWDPYAGKQKGWEQATSENGDPLFIHPITQEETPEPFSMGAYGEQINHEPMKGENPVFEGMLKWEVIHPYNLKRPKNCETLRDAPWVIIDKLTDKSEAELLIKNSPDYEDLKSSLTANSSQAFKVFEASSGEYVDSNDQVLLNYHLYRPCYDLPKGWFVIRAGETILVENELPFGIWPFVSTGFKISAGSPRGKSIIRDLRPSQIELNRLVSAAAYHSIAFGDDKLVTQMGGKLTLGSTYNGLRHFQVSGPGGGVTYLPGRDGGQFEGQIERQIKTLYAIGQVEAINQTPASQQDPTAMLYQSLKQKAKLAPYAQKFQSFTIECWDLYLKLCKHYYSDDMVINAVGKREAVNIAEFKAISDDGYRIDCAAVNDDVDSMIGRSLQIQQLLQYAGKDLPNSVKARVARMMPFMNDTQMFSELLLDDENIDSDILALDRGESRPAMNSDNHDAYIKRLTNRIKQNDFRLLSPHIQNAYHQKLSQHEQLKAQQLNELREAEAGWIPTGGALVKLDLYGNDGRRATAPYEALRWLLSKMEMQGQSQQALQEQEMSQQVNVLKNVQAMNPPQQAPQSPQGIDPQAANQPMHLGPLEQLLRAQQPKEMA